MIKARLNLKYIIGFVLFILLLINIYLWTKSIVLGDSIRKMEIETAKLKVENEELERKVYSLGSLQNLEQAAGRLGFTKRSEPIYLESLKYAQAK